MVALYIVLAAAGLVAAWLVWTFNRLVRHRNFVSEGWAGIDVQLRRRHDLVPNLIEIAEAYRVHEHNLLERVAALRSEGVRETRVSRLGAVEGQLGKALGDLFAVVENYPDLRAADVYMKLQRDLIDVEDHLQMARRYYNGTVRNLNTIVEMFPSNLVARLFGFRAAEFFDLGDPDARAAPAIEAG